MKGEYYRMEYEAWDEGTEELSLEDEAAYLRLCHQMYRRRGAVPNNLSSLGRLWRCHPNKARKLLQNLLDTGKITLTQDGHLTNTRVRQEIDHRETVLRRKSDAGKIGGARVRDKFRKPNEINGDDQADASQLKSSIPYIREDKRREEKRREEEYIGDTKTEIVPVNHEGSASPPSVTASDDEVESRYAFESGVIRLNARDLNRWKRTFQAINVEATLERRSAWIESEHREKGSSWFHLCQSVLGKANAEAERQMAEIREKAQAQASQAVKPRRSLV
jgi:uncharacterized protein YdaU (DUF1376 family)